VPLGVHRDDLGSGPYIDATPLAERLHRVGKQLVRAGHRAREVVGKAAQPVGDIGAGLEDDDLETRVDPTGRRGGRHPGRPTADHHESSAHLGLPVTGCER
jgi:hypothetical protein